MAAISNSPPSSIAATATVLRCARFYPPRLPPSSSLCPRPNPRLSIGARLYSSKPSSGANGSLEEDHSSSSPNDAYELEHAALPPPPHVSAKAVPVFVTLPIDAVSHAGMMTRRKAMEVSFMSLALAGVEGVAVELWWGIVERDGPGIYDWRAYMHLVVMARRYQLKVRAIMAFHQSGTGPGDPSWIPLPRWVLEEMEKKPDLLYSDKFGRRSKECISLGCDMLPVLRGRSPIQAYSDFMMSFRGTFKDFLGVTVTEIQVGMGPAGELRYPSCPTEMLIRPSNKLEIGEFQCYDKYMLASLDACAQKVGFHGLGDLGSFGTSDLMHNSEQESLIETDATWSSTYGPFFLEWYSGMLLLHGERLCMVTKNIFSRSSVQISGKVAGIYWHHYTSSRPSELTAGYYNTLTRDGYLPIARMFGRYKMAMCCACFDMQDADVENKPRNSPEGFLRQLVRAARICNLPLFGENSVTRLDDASLMQVIRSCRLYPVGSYETSLSFNYVRMNKDLFDPHNWKHFTRFVRQMSDARTFQARLASRRCRSCLTSAAEEVGRVFACH